MFTIPRAVSGLLVASLTFFTSTASPLAGSALVQTQRTEVGESIFKLGNVSYLAHLSNPKAIYGCKSAGSPGKLIPITVIKSNASVISGSFIEETLANYTAGDDVYSAAFLEGVFISSTSTATLDASAVSFLESLNITYLFLDSSISSLPSGTIPKVIFLATKPQEIPAGPYVTEFASNSVTIFAVSRLYEDIYRDFLFGVYETSDGEYQGLGAFNPYTWFPYIPVPSRIYSWSDDRPLAGERVAIKDLYDLKGTQTSAGSHSYIEVTPIANKTAPSIQRIIDLGGVIVGKQKLAQFASGANPWQWQDQHYPWNPRGDGWLTCSASSSGGGCSIAGYDWLDFAIGSDTGSSMRRPAAVAGVYGQRPSQGLMSLEGVFPLSFTADTAGVFSRDPYKWSKFSKLWYTEELHQDTNITGLSSLVVPDTNAFAKRILYAVDYLPLNNSAAEVILQDFIANMTRIFNMTVENFNMSLAVTNFTSPLASNYTVLSRSGSPFSNYATYTGYGRHMVSEWAEKYDGRYPPLDPSWRSRGWTENTTVTGEAYDLALRTKRQGVEWYEENVQFSTPESCSESIMLHDIGTGGFPSYREENLNKYPNTSFLATNMPYNTVTRAGLCPQFGCADFTVPIGQVPYWSNVTFHEEFVPVTINMVVKRGCDFVLMNMIEKLADEGVLKTVKTGRTPY